MKPKLTSQHLLKVLKWYKQGNSLGEIKILLQTKYKIKISRSRLHQLIKELTEQKSHKDPDWGYLIPKGIERTDYERFDSRHFYSAEQYSSLVENLKKERRTWLLKFPALEPEIIQAIP